MPTCRSCERNHKKAEINPSAIKAEYGARKAYGQFTIDDSGAVEAKAGEHTAVGVDNRRYA